MLAPFTQIFPLLLILATQPAPKVGVVQYEADKVEIQAPETEKGKKDGFTHVHQSMVLDLDRKAALRAIFRYHDRTETYVYTPGKTQITIARPGKRAEMSTHVDEDVDEARSQIVSMLGVPRKKPTAVLAGIPCVIETDVTETDGARIETRSWNAVDTALDYALGSLQLLRYRIEGGRSTMLEGYRLLNVRVTPLARRPSPARTQRSRRDGAR